MKSERIPAPTNGGFSTFWTCKLEGLDRVTVEVSAPSRYVAKIKAARILGCSPAIVVASPADELPPTA